MAIYYEKRKTKAELMENLPADAIQESARLVGVATLQYRLKGGGFGVMYHWTEVVRTTEQGILVNARGYETQTTKERINRYLPVPWQVIQNNFIWYFRNWRTEETIEFEDGMIVPLIGSPYNPEV